MGFWKTLFRVCSGRDVFLQLLDCGFGRALLHLLCLFLLLAFCLASGHSCRFSPEMRRMHRMADSLFDEIGSLRFEADKGLRTANRPETKQSYLLDAGFRLDYCPGSTLTEADMASWEAGSGVVVMDKGMVFWLADPAGTGSGQYWIVPVPLSGDVQMPSGGKSQNGMSRGAAYEYLKKNFELAPGQRMASVMADATRELVTGYLSAAFGVLVFFFSLFTMVMLTGITVLFFGLMQLVMSSFGGPRLSPRQILVELIYTAFPALVIASLYSFFMIPQIMPQMVFFAVYLIYYLAVFRKIRLALQPPSPEQPDDF